MLFGWFYEEIRDCILFPLAVTAFGFGIGYWWEGIWSGIVCAVLIWAILALAAHIYSHYIEGED